MLVAFKTFQASSFHWRIGIPEMFFHALMCYFVIFLYPMFVTVSGLTFPMPLYEMICDSNIAILERFCLVIDCAE